MRALRDRTSPLQLWIAAAFVILAIPAAAIVPTWDDPGDPQDEGLLLVEPELLRDGSFPYRDYESLYGPANTAVLAGVYALTGPDVTAERAVGLVYRLGVVAGVFAIASGVGLPVAVASGLIAGAFVDGPSAVAWFGGLALAIWGLFALQRAGDRAAFSGRLLLLAGLLAGLALSFRPQFAAASALGYLPLLAWRPAWITKRILVGMVIGALPLLALTAIAGPANVFDNLVVAALFRSAPQSTLPFPVLSSAEGRLLMLLFASILVLCVCAGVAWRRARGAPEARALISIALFSLGLLPQALGRIETVHILYVGCFAVALVPRALASPLVLGRISIGMRQAVAVAVTLLAVGLLAQTWLRGVRINLERAAEVEHDPVTSSYDRRENWVTRGDRSFPLYSPEFADNVAAALAVIDRLSSPGDRLIVAPEDLRRTFYNHTALYYLLPELEPGTYYVTMTPGTANRAGSPLAQNVSDADIVVLGTSSDWHAVAPNSELGDDAAREVLRDEFCLRAHPYPYRIFTRCDPD
jgi:hypothetical protein